METQPIIHVLDLPQIYKRPSAESILDALALLTSAPPSWEGSDPEAESSDDSTATPRLRNRTSRRVNPEGVTRYLTGIIGSDLRWIKDEDLKEQIWDLASARLTERSGRTAMSAISRTFRIPLGPKAAGTVDLTIHEPALTADNLGFKTWAASFLLSKRLCKLDAPVLASELERLRILELGSGTGLVGLAAACVFGADVVLTDMESIFSNLRHNIDRNRDVVAQKGGTVEGGILDWTEPDTCRVIPGEAGQQDKVISSSCKFPVIVAADSLYSAEHPQLLVNTIALWLSKEEDARVMVEFPLRDAYMAEIEDFRARMRNIGLDIVAEGEESGLDDWGWGCEGGVGGHDQAHVRCWWAVWGRPRRVCR